MTISLLLIAAGIAMLYAGGEFFVLSASSLALRMGLTPLVVGLTVVAYGTSFPELVVSGLAALDQKGDLVYGNILGANIFNSTVILGIAALIRPLHVHPELISLHAPAMIGATLAAMMLFATGLLNRISGTILVVLLMVYTIVSVRAARKASTNDIRAEFREGLPPRSRHPVLDLSIMAGCFALMWAGAQFMINGGVGLARLWGVSEAVIGLTIISIGTSLPELAISVTAAARDKADIAIGNVVGSNIFRLIGILGFCALLSPFQVFDIGWFDFAVTLALGALSLVFLLNQRLLLRWEGTVLLAAYFAYIIYRVGN